MRFEHLLTPGIKILLRHNRLNLTLVLFYAIIRSINLAPLQFLELRPINSISFDWLVVSNCYYPIKFVTQYGLGSSLIAQPNRTQRALYKSWIPYAITMSQIRRWIHKGSRKKTLVFPAIIYTIQIKFGTWKFCRCPRVLIIFEFIATKWNIVTCMQMSATCVGPGHFHAWDVA